MTKKKEKKLDVKAVLGTVSLVAVVASLGANMAMAETKNANTEDKKLVSGSDLSEAEYDNYYLEYMYENYLKENAKKMREEKRRATLEARGISEEELEAKRAEEEAQANVQNLPPCVACAVQQQQMQNQGQGVYFDVNENEVSFGTVPPNQQGGMEQPAQIPAPVPATMPAQETVAERETEPRYMEEKRAVESARYDNREQGIFYELYKDEDEEDLIDRKYYGRSYYEHEDEEQETAEGRERKTNDVGGRRKNTEEEKIVDRDMDYDDTLFYIRAIAGLGKLGRYKMSYTDTPSEKVNMKTDKKRLDLSVALGWGFANKWDLEIEGEKIDWKDIKPETKINDSLVDYSHKIKTLSLGVNAIYNLNNYRTSWVTPFIGFGAGISQFKVADYGSVWQLNGETEDADGNPVTANTEGAEEVSFESGAEKKNRPYVKAIAGITLKLSDYTSLLLKGDYKVFNDFTSPQGMKLSDLSSVTGSVGLRVNF